MNVVRLVKKAKRGSKDALLQLIMAEQESYYKLALTYMGNSHDAMDAMEEMIVILYEKVGQLKKEESFYSWSKTILVNQCKSMLRKQQKLLLKDDLHELSETEEIDHTTINPYITSEQQMDIQQMLTHLNDDQREAIQLKYFHDYDNKTIADMTNVSIGTVKSRIFNGLKKLKALHGGDRYE